MNRRDILLGAGALLATSTGARAGGAQLTVAAAADALKQAAVAAPGMLGTSGRIAPAAFATLALPGIDGLERAAFLRLFFAGSRILVSGANAPSPLVGYYNSIMDSWWVTRWEGATGVVDARLAPAPLFGTQANGRPGWISRLPGWTPLEALEAGIRSAVAEFRAEFPFGGRGFSPGYDRISRGAERVAAMSSRVAAIAGALASLQTDREAMALYSELRRALAEPEPEGVGRFAPQAMAMRERLHALIGADAGRLSPVGAVRASNGWVVLSAGRPYRQSLVACALEPRQPHPFSRLALVGTPGE